MNNEFFLIGEITDETLKSFVEFLKSTKNEPVKLHINSAGGDIFSAIAISNLIKNKNVTVQVDGLAASAATLICCGAKCVAVENAMFMMHLPLVGLADFYNAEELAKIQNSLTEITQSLISIYTSKLKLSAEEITAAMAAETWLNAAEAKEIGLVDEIGGAAAEIKNSAGVLFVNNIAFPNIKLKLEDTKLDNIMAEKLTNSVLTAERARVSALMAMKNDSPAVNSIINKAIENGKTAEEIKIFIDTINETKAQEENKTKSQFDEFYKLLKDNLTSGAENVQGNPPPPTEQEKNAAYAADIAKYTNEILKGKYK